jgi:hypothetical protein
LFMKMDGWIGNRFLDHLSGPLHSPTVSPVSSESSRFVNPEPRFCGLKPLFSEGFTQ